MRVQTDLETVQSTHALMDTSTRYFASGTNTHVHRVVPCAHTALKRQHTKHTHIRLTRSCSHAKLALWRLWPACTPQHSMVMGGDDDRQSTPKKEHTAKKDTSIETRTCLLLFTARQHQPSHPAHTLTLYTHTHKHTPCVSTLHTHQHTLLCVHTPLL